MRLLAILLLFIGTAVAQLSDEEWLPNRIENWTQQPDGFGGLKFGASQAAVEKQLSLQATQIDSRNIGKAYRTEMNVWGVDLSVSMMFLSDHLSLIRVGYPGEQFIDVKTRMIELLGPIHKAHNTLSGPMKGEDLFWYGRDVFVRLTDNDRTHSHGFFMATYEYMKDYGGGGEMMRPVDPPAWVPYPAGHWPQEPDGFNGLRFDATRAETEKTIKLENCQTVMYGNLSCDTILMVDGKPFKGNILFGVPQGSPITEGRLTNISCAFHKDDLALVKAAFMNMFGQPHGTSPMPNGESGETIMWAGNKALVRLWVLRDNAGFVISPNMFARGATFGTSVTITSVTNKKQK